MDNVITPNFTKNVRRLSRRRKTDGRQSSTDGKWLGRLGFVYSDVVLDTATPESGGVESTTLNWKRKWLARLGIEYRVLYAEPTSYRRHKRVAWASDVMLLLSMAIPAYCLLCLGRLHPHFDEGMLLGLASVVTGILTQARVPSLLVRRAEDAR